MDGLFSSGLTGGSATPAASSTSSTKTTNNPIGGIGKTVTSLTPHELQQKNYNKEQQNTISSSERGQFDYTKHIAKFPTPNKGNLNPFTYVVNAQVALDTGNAYLTTGKTQKGDSVVMGNAAFIRSGTCDNVLSDDECKGKPRYMFINNVPSEHVPCSNPTQPVDPSGKSTFPKGLVNGVINDVVSMNPFELLASANGTGSIVNNKCVLRSEMTGYVAPNGVNTMQPETQCSSPLDTLVCSTHGGQSTGCVQLAPLPQMKAFNSVAMAILKDTVQISNTQFGMDNQSYGLNGNYPVVNTSTAKSTFGSTEMTAWQNTIVTTTESQLKQAVSKHYTPAQVTVNSKGRCLIAYAECTPKGYTEYHWLAFHEFVGLPQTKRCASASTEAECNGTHGSYCDWKIGSAPNPTCEIKNPTIQVSWYAFYSEEHQKTLVSPMTVSPQNNIPNQDLPFGNAFFYDDLPANDFTTVNDAVSESFVDFKARPPTRSLSRTRYWTTKRVVCVCVLVLLCLALCVALVGTCVKQGQC